MAENFIKSILRLVLPDPNTPFSLFNPKSYVSEAVPNSIYEYAGYTKGNDGKFTIKQDASTLNKSNMSYKPTLDLRPSYPGDKSGATVIGGDSNTTNNNSTNISNTSVVGRSGVVDVQDQFGFSGT